MSRVLPLLLLSGCAVFVPPGDQPMGQYSMNATSAVRACALDEVSSDDLSFVATLSRDTQTGAAWLSLGGYVREASFDGQYFVSEASATRVFTSCSTCQTQLRETYSVAVLSRSQSDALGGQCPESPLDGGVPPIGGAITGPQQTNLGFDAARVCGELVVQVVSSGLTDGGSCPEVCMQCEVRYQLRGTRR